MLDVSALAVPTAVRDWTFYTAYSGTLTHVGGAPVAVCPCEDRIDYGVLRRPDPLLFADTVVLFEDELDDNGCSKLSVKIVSEKNLPLIQWGLE